MILINDKATRTFTALHQVLTMPELLTSIFSQSEDRDLANVARSCRLWSTIALDVLWRSIPNLAILLRTGCSLQYISGVSSHSLRRASCDRHFNALQYALRLGSLQVLLWIECGILFKDMHGGSGG